MRQVRLPDSCDIRNVSQLHALLVDALSSGDQVEVDGSAVARCDTAAGQLFVSAARDPHVHWRLSDTLRAQLGEAHLPLMLFREDAP